MTNTDDCLEIITDLRRQLAEAQVCMVSDLEACWPTANMAIHADAAEARAERDDLRRQLAEAQERQVVAMRERDSLRGMLTGCREAIGATDNTQLLEMCEAAAALREQLAAERGRLEYEAGAAQAALLIQLADVQSRLIAANAELAELPAADLSPERQARLQRYIDGGAR